MVSFPHLITYLSLFCLSPTYTNSPVRSICLQEFPDLPDLPIHFSYAHHPQSCKAQCSIVPSLCHHAKTFPIRIGRHRFVPSLSPESCFGSLMFLSAYQTMPPSVHLPFSCNCQRHQSNAYRSKALQVPSHSHSNSKHLISPFLLYPGDWGSPQSAFGYPNAMLAKPVAVCLVPTPRHFRKIRFL